MKSRSGLTIHLFLSIFLGVIILIVAGILNHARSQAAPNLITKIKASYQMESAITMALQKIKLAADDPTAEKKQFNLKKIEISPGQFLTLIHNRVSSSEHRFEVRVDGAGLNQRLSAIAKTTAAHSSKPQVPSTGWSIEYVPPENQQ